MQYLVRDKKKIPELRDLWSLKRGEITAVVGAGGKTSTMNILAREFKFSRVIYTTTTAVLLPENIPCRFKVVDSAEDLQGAVERYKNVSHQNNPGRVLVVGKKLIPAHPGSRAKKKLIGLEKRWLNSLVGKLSNIKVLVEADGANSHRVKAPAEYEPVIPNESSNLIVIQGGSALGRKLHSPHCFRAKLIKANFKYADVKKRINFKLYQQLFVGRPGYGRYIHKFPNSRLVLTQCNRSLFRFCRRFDRELVNNYSDRVEGLTALNYNSLPEIIYHSSY